MEDRKIELEKTLESVNKNLDREKRVRDTIMVVLHTLLCGSVLYYISHGFDSITDVLCLGLISIFFGAILYFGTMFTYHGVTGVFTHIYELEDQKRYLEHKLKYDIKK